MAEACLQKYSRLTASSDAAGRPSWMVFEKEKKSIEVTVGEESRTQSLWGLLERMRVCIAQRVKEMAREPGDTIDLRNKTQMILR